MRNEYRYTVPATDKNGQPINEGYADTLAEARALARQFLEEYEDATLVEVISVESGDCVWDKRRGGK